MKITSIYSSVDILNSCSFRSLLLGVSLEYIKELKSVVIRLVVACCILLAGLFSPILFPLFTYQIKNKAKVGIKIV